MKKFKKNAVLISLIGMLCTNILGCSANSNIIDEATIATELDIGEEDYDVSRFLIQDEEEAEEETIEESPEILEDDNVVYTTEKSTVVSVPVVIATSNVNIRDDIDGNILGVLPEGHNLELLEVIDDTHYKVLYYGQEAYVVSKYATLATIYDINSDVTKIVYAEEDTELLIPSELSATGEDEYKAIPKYECFEVYEELDNSYLVQTADYVGYVSKENLILLEGTFVVIDISDQNLKLYENNEVILDCPVITGKPSTPTPVGRYAIFEISHTRYLIGRNNSYRSWVDVMMNFNGNIGLHDAERRVTEDGKVLGWRDTNQFGGVTQQENGSHGCVNMRCNDVNFVEVHTGIGTIVLVKK